ncbi:MAG TPA: PA14 domain-containing protein, partial [Acidimicrobiales bacterium]|nr:PA14 domain-containing protein [Acidimicrobiales bacterium]
MESVVPLGDFSPLGLPGIALPTPRGFDALRSTEIETLGTATRRVFLNPDGSKTINAYAQPVRMQRGGKWVDIDLALVKEPDGGARPEAAPVDAHVGSNASGPVGRVGVPGGAITLRHPDASAVAGEVKGGSVVFAKALPGDRDIEVRPTVGGFEEIIVLPTTEAAGAYQVRLDAPPGATARQEGDRVVVVGGDQTRLATFKGGVAVDANDASTPVRTRLVGSAADGIAVEVSIDDAWLHDAARRAPVRIDPTVTREAMNPGGLLYIGDDGNSYPYSSVLDVGRQPGGPAFRALAHFDFFGIAAQPGVQVFNATFEAFNFDSGSCDYRDVAVYGLGGPFNDASTHWNDQPGLDGQGAYDISTFADGDDPDCDAPAWEQFDVTALAQRWLDTSAPNYGLELRSTNEGDPAGYRRFSGYVTNQTPHVNVTYNTPPNPPLPISPADGTVFTNSTTPTLSATSASDPDGDSNIKYLFRIASGPDADTGAVVESGIIPTTTWTPPVGALQDGGTYYWHAFSWDGSQYSTTTWARRMVINQRLGTANPSPQDTVGPVSVNLATGNLAFTLASPSFPATGGSAGVSFSYNSLPVVRNRNGLSAQYFNDNGDNAFGPTDDLVLTRLDSQVQFNWGLGSPSPAVNADHFLARWTGSITVPSTQGGFYYFAADHDDGVRIWVKNTLVFDRWGIIAENRNYGYSTPIFMQAGETAAIRVEHMENAGAAGVTLRVNGNGVNDAVVPAGWLTPDDRTMPLGWSMSADGDGDASFTSARVSEGGVTFVEPDGTPHAYTWTGSGWTPPAGENGVVTRLTTGGVRFESDDGRSYTFGLDGGLTQIDSAIDDRAPASLRYAWTGTPLRLTTITDPVTGRNVTLDYGGRATCAHPGNFAATPSGMLCQVNYWDGSDTRLYYNASGQLVRIVDPGGSEPEVTDIGYAADGRVARLRDPLAADAVANGRPDDNSTYTEITYLNDAVSAVAQPAPNAALPTQRPTHRYSYSVNGTQTDVTLDGQTWPNNFWRRVGIDAAGREISDTDAANVTTTSAWDVSDRMTKSVDSAGFVSTKVYDAHKWLTDEYGPAPSNCFLSNGRPASCGITVPHTNHAYDEGLVGLAAAYWPNTSLSGAPLAHRNGTADNPAGDLWFDWGTGQPAGLSAGDNWSGRYTGELLFPAQGTYTLRFRTDDGVRLWIDDKLVVDEWSDHASTWTVDKTFATSAPNTTHRVRVEYFEHGGGAGLQFYWVPPGASQQVAVPGANMHPLYGLATSTDDDGQKVSTVYAEPELGLATATVKDPAGLNLRSTTTYEPGGAGRYYRPISRSLPRAAGGGYTTAVGADNPAAYWRLGEASGTAAADASGHGLTGTYVAPTTLGAAGAVGDGNTAVSLSGGYVSTPYTQSAVSAYSAEAWVKTTDPGLNKAIIQDRGTGAGKSLTLSLGGAPGTAAAYNALTPTRILDTRPGELDSDGFNAPLGQGQTIDVPVLGLAGVPANGVDAVVLTVTAIAPSADGYLQVYSTGHPPAANVSTLNFGAGRTTANAVIAKVGDNGKVSVYNAWGTTNVVYDVSGFFMTGSALHAVAPVRILDTRPGELDSDGFNAAVGPGQTIDVPVLGLGGVPATGVDTVVLNVTAVGPSAPGFLSVFPTGSAPTTGASTLNFSAGENEANLVLAKVGANGKVSVHNENGTTHVLYDVSGYFATGSAYTSSTPTRILDTRPGVLDSDGFNQPVLGGQTIDVPVLGRGGVPATGVDAVVLNVTAANTTAAGFLQVFPTGRGPGSTSTVNFGGGEARADLVVAKVGDGGKVSVFNATGSADVIYDVMGYFPVGPRSGDVAFGVDTDNVFAGVYTTQAIDDGQWHHVVGTWSAPPGTPVSPSQFRIYLDGALAPTGTSVIGTPPVSPLTGLGGMRLGQSDPWATTLAGSLDDVAVYASALSPAAVASHHDATVTSSAAETYEYYPASGAGSSVDNPCTGPVESIYQGASLYRTTAPDPDGSGPQASIVTEQIYNTAGRVLASRIVGDAAWSCTTYDGRGRVVTEKDSSGKTTTYTYTNPLAVATTFVDSSGGARLTIDAVDILGRSTTYTDEQGTITSSTYDLVGRLAATTRKFPGLPDAPLTTTGYSADDRVATFTDYSGGPARTTSYGYDAAGRPTTTTRPNGVVSTATYEPQHGYADGVSHTKAGSSLSDWHYTRTVSGDVASETGNGRVRNFGYDATGRLTSVTQGPTTRRYAYDANSNRCGLAAACDGAWSYDAADRITASPYATGYTYDAHGNVVQASLGGAAPPVNLSDQFAMSTSGHSTPITVRSDGTLNAALDWSGNAHSAETSTGALAASGATSRDVVLGSLGLVKSELGWTASAHNVAITGGTGSITAGGTGGSGATGGTGPAHTFNVTTPGTIHAGVDWA